MHCTHTQIQQAPVHLELMHRNRIKQSFLLRYQQPITFSHMGLMFYVKIDSANAFPPPIIRMNSFSLKS